MSLMLKGLLHPPEGFVSALPPLLSDASPVAMLSWNSIKQVAASGVLDGKLRYGTLLHQVQQHNNCNSAAAASVVAKTYRDATGKLCKLSDTYIYSLINGGRDQGSMLADAMVAIQTSGVCLAQYCGPDAIYRNQYEKRPADENAKAFMVRECYAIRPRDFGSTDELQRAFWTALACGFKVAVAVEADSRFERVSNGICGVDDGRGNHAVHCDGLRMASGKLVATGENSWPLSIPCGGRIGLLWEHFEQTIGVHEFYAVRGIEGGVDDRPKVS